MTTKRVSYDYDNQAWIVNGVYVCCSHPAEMNCRCFGKLHAGEKPDPSVSETTDRNNRIGLVAAARSCDFTTH